MSSSTSTADRTALAVILAPEDLRCGEYVAVLDEIVEVPSWLWCDAPTDAESTKRIRYRAEGGGIPLKVKAICLPFVFVTSAQRQKRTLDVRQYQLVRLDRHYARTVWKQLRRESGTSQNL